MGNARRFVKYLGAFALLMALAFSTATVNAGKKESMCLVHFKHQWRANACDCVKASAEGECKALIYNLYDCVRGESSCVDRGTCPDGLCGWSNPYR